MRRWIPLCAALALLPGCSSEPTATPIEPDPPAPSTGAQGSSGVGVITGGAGGVAPVTGSESLQGPGSGVGQAAKDSARSAASRVSGSQPGAGQADAGE